MKKRATRQRATVFISRELSGIADGQGKRERERAFISVFKAANGSQPKKKRERERVILGGHISPIVAVGKGCKGHDGPSQWPRRGQRIKIPSLSLPSRV